MADAAQLFLSVLVPVLAMLAAALFCALARPAAATAWRVFHGLSLIALSAAAIALAAILIDPLALALPADLQPVLQAAPLTLVIAVLVQWLGTVIGAFSARYLQGEANQTRYVAALAGVLAAVQVLLLANHWLVLIAAWASVGMVLQQLLCFYPERPFARLAAHKKRLADRAADVLLVIAAALAWWQTGSGALSDLWAATDGNSLPLSLQGAAVALVLAVILRTALMPVHGWLIQVMEAPTPVSAMLHAGVVNLGGGVLIRFAPLLEEVLVARVLLLVFGLGTAVLAGMVMLTRISIKVRLAWSTVAQMGFMLFECGLGLYTLAALHLIGHSLYKAQAFLSASGVVRQTRIAVMHGGTRYRPASLVLAPLAAIALVVAIVAIVGMVGMVDMAGLPAAPVWPLWWSLALGLAWAPLLWLPAAPTGARTVGLHLMSGVAMVAGLTALAVLTHALPLGVHDAPHALLGWIGLAGLAGLYCCMVALQVWPGALPVWRRWSYSGFYLDESFTRLALRLWPAHRALARPGRGGAAAVRHDSHGLYEFPGKTRRTSA